ncbi:MAG: hypothetical protein J7494_01560 [Sphingobium sp.]|nr:hypothetical protein [Sphingobium sp.]
MRISGRQCGLVVAGALLACLPAMRAEAADEEIQVYVDDIGARGAVGLDVHINHVLDGDPGADYAGGEPGLHRLRVTPEFSLGLGGGFEAGLYLPLATIAGDTVLRFQGVKLRMKWIAPHDEAKGFYWGANFEIGRVAYRLDRNPWNAELKTIAGWRGGKWSLAVNGNLDFKVSGPVSAPATFQLATKISRDVAPGLALGIESYNDFGSFSRFGRFGENEQATYLTVDAQTSGWEFNVGIGRGYAASSDHLIAKMVVGVPL